MSGGGGGGGGGTCLLCLYILPLSTLNLQLLLSAHGCYSKFGSGPGGAGGLELTVMVLVI